MQKMQEIQKDLLEEETATHSSILVWKKICGQRSLAGYSPWGLKELDMTVHTSWRRKWQPTAVFLPGESQEQWSLVGCRLWGLTELDTTEAT